MDEFVQHEVIRERSVSVEEVKELREDRLPVEPRFKTVECYVIPEHVIHKWSPVLKKWPDVPADAHPIAARLLDLGFQIYEASIGSTSGPDLSGFTRNVVPALRSAFRVPGEAGENKNSLAAKLKREQSLHDAKLEIYRSWTDENVEKLKAEIQQQLVKLCPAATLEEDRGSCPRVVSIKGFPMDTGATLRVTLDDPYDVVVTRLAYELVNHRKR
jgi:hypothetical protein